MKKLLTLFSIFTLVVLLAGLTSALQLSINDNDHPSNSLTPFDNVTLTLTNDGNVTQSGSISFGVGATKFQGIKATPSQFSNLGPGDSQEIVISVDNINTNGLKVFDTISVEVTAQSTINTESDSATLSYVQTFCPLGPARHDILVIDDVKIENEGDGDDSDEDTWFIGDIIELTFQIDNKGDKDLSSDDLDDLNLEVQLLDSDGNDILDDFDFIEGDNEESIGGLDPDDSDEEVIIRFLVTDFDDEGDYELIVRVAEDGNEENVCTDYASDLDDNDGFSKTIKLDRENDKDRFVRFNDIQLSSNQLTCGEPFRLEADAINVGDEDVDELRVRMFNQEMGIDMTQEVRSSLNPGDEERVAFEFTVPQGLANKEYELSLTSMYEVDDDERLSELRERVFVTVIGCGVTSGDGLRISAGLASAANAGEELVISVSVTNLGNTEDTVSLDARSFQGWAELVSLSPRVLNLAPGETRATTILLKVNEDAVGPQSLIFEARGNTVEVQEIEVNIQGTSSQGLGTGLSNLFSGENSGLIWIIAIINIVLIVLIIFVAVRLSRR